MGMLFFLGQVIGISLSGVMAPGPVTATTIVMGSRNRWAGALIAVGHGIVEFPLIVLIVVGLGTILKLPAVQIAIGLAGAVFLFMMASEILWSSQSADQQCAGNVKGNPILAGVALTAGNPYFLLWWATIGLGLATRAQQLGIWAFVVFAVVHWLCDFFWLTALSWATYRGSTLLGTRILNIVLMVCSGALRFFGIIFAYGALATLIEVLGT
ncbi:MAG: LysE family transporter [Sedimentisphaerales bacterium]|nr:LysE family transporter [Sedimentisphaerales bacterium]